MTRMNGSSDSSSARSNRDGMRKRRSAANLVYWQQTGKSVPKTFCGVWKLFKRNATPRLFISVLGQAQDFYDFSIISWVKKLMSEQYPVNTTDEALVSSMPILGAVVGMVVMGYLIDKIGRKAASMITPIVIIVSSVLSAAASDGCGKQGTVMPFFIGKEKADTALSLHNSWKARTEDSFDAMELSRSQD
eukprot:jgi/Pico_ML_1/55502/g1177.t1